ncbi:MAG TPA: L-histidine N(alpha)-methyltransferase [Vicinamibacterales bacterium]|nr:L-histidine N(alpha)-methyltransferase [Vicinamibacterales bacterium]
MDLEPTADLPARAFAADVRRGLTCTPKQLPPRYFYDPLGSTLFEAICRLPWYRITRAECALLARIVGGLAGAAAGGTVVELGCGNGEKLALLADALRQRGAFPEMHLVDVSSQAIDKSRDRLERLGFPVVAHHATYEQGLRRARASGAGPALVLFLGSNVGNFDPPEALAFLREIRSTLRDGDGLLLGADLTKPERDLLLAYDDPLGVTAAFNRNLLVRINRELGADFELDAFFHRALWNSAERRVEMHLVSTRAQDVRIPAAGLVVRFEAGEHMWTESSYKYEPEQVGAMVAAAGFDLERQWIDDEARFALTLSRAR